jgi:hypothetical protein
MAGKIGWEHLNFGALNLHDGECDLARNVVIFIGIPVAVVYTAAHHRIDLAGVRNPARRERLRAFLAEYYGWAAERARSFRDTVHIPIKKRPGLGWMAGLHALLWVAGVLGFVGAFAIMVFATMARPMKADDWVMLWFGAASLAVLVVGSFAYFRLRRPSRRQARIRAVVADCLGPYADLADWKVDSLGPLFPRLGVVEIDPGATLAQAEALRGAGRVEEALLWARVAIAFAHPREDRALVTQAEALTDDCLALLERAGTVPGA